MYASHRLLICLSLIVLGTSACDDAEKDARISALEQELSAAQAATDKESERAAAQEGELEGIQLQLAELEMKLGEAQNENEALEGDKGQLEGELEQSAQALESMEALQAALSTSLVEEIETGEVRVAKRGGLLVVNVSDKVLFARGEAVLSERGQQVIRRLSTSLLGLPKDLVFQVGGHTDNQAIKSEEVLARFPTNWELSAARATTVVRFLEESCSVPGKRLTATGFSSFRPAASNKKKKGRAKNRRIEIALVRGEGR